MYTHILVPTDSSALCDNAVRHAIIVARRFGAKITALHVVMASHGRRGWQALLGSQTVRMLTHSNIPVLVCR